MLAKLTIELVPKTCFYKNLRTDIPDTWSSLRKECYRKANYVCAICGGKGDKRSVEAHEIWQYDDDNYIQKLTGLIALCSSCHEVKHFGKATIDGYAERAIAHLCKVNNWTEELAESYIGTVFDLWRKRSKHEWKQDISWLTCNKPSRFKTL